MVRNGPGNLDVKLIVTRLYGVVVERTIVDMVNVAEHETNRYELDTFEDGALIQQLRDDETERRRIEAHQAAVVDELNHRRAYRRDGHASIAGYSVRYGHAASHGPFPRSRSFRPGPYGMIPG